MASRPQKKSAGDLTGRKLAEEQAKQRQAEEDRSQELAMATAARKQAIADGVFDPQTGERLDEQTFGDDVEDLTVQTLDEDDEVLEVDVEDVSGEPEAVARIAEDAHFFLGTDEFNLKGGHKYKLPVSTITYLDEKGLIWH